LSRFFLHLKSPKKKKMESGEKNAAAAVVASPDHRDDANGATPLPSSSSLLPSLPPPECSKREEKKRQHVSAMKRRESREKLEREIKNVIAKPPRERTIGEAELLDEHKEKVAFLLTQMEKSLKRKNAMEEKAEEKEDSRQEIDDGVAVVMRLLREDANCSFVLHTGAGISTSAKIPDFRGKNGVWTKQRKGEVVHMPKFENTKPTRAHMACKAMFDAKVLSKIVTQNVDGLHQRAGVPDEAVAELHGSVYKERCSSCERVYCRDFDVTSTKPSHGKNRHRTGRTCEVEGCDGYLKDTIVQFGESLDDETLEKAREWSKEANMSVVVGSSLRVPPASTLPRMAKKHCVVVNLQWTSQDAKATMKLHAKADDVLVQMCKHLSLEIPEYDPMTESVGRKVKERGEIFACEVEESDWNENGMEMRDIDEKLKEATTGMTETTTPATAGGTSGVGKTSARILFGEADGGKKLSKTAREALIREERRLKEEREGIQDNRAKKKKSKKRKSKSLTMKPKSKMPCFPRPGAKETPLTNNSSPLFDASKIVKKKRTPVKKKMMVVKKEEKMEMPPAKKIKKEPKVSASKLAAAPPLEKNKKTKDEKKKKKVAKTEAIVVKTEQPIVLPPSDEDIARMLFAEINGMRRRR